MRRRTKQQDEQPAATPIKEPNQPQESTNSAKGSGLCGKHLLALIPILLALAFYIAPTVSDLYEIQYGYGERMMYEVSPLIMEEFHKYDLDSSGFIDPQEFINIALDLKMDTNATKDSFMFIDKELEMGKEALMIVADFTPLNISTMTKFEKQGTFMFGPPEKLLPGLTSWKKAQHPFQAYGAQNFKAFLPLTTQTLFLDPYYVIDAELYGRQTQMSYYHPSAPRGREEILHALLSQFHPNIFVNCRFGPRGTLAVIRAENDDHYDVVIRAHAEFQLNEEPNYPFWFTPAQFKGRLIITKDGSHVEYFEIHVPNYQSLNVDMEWVTGPNGNEVDIGYMPMMRLYSLAPSNMFNTTDDLNYHIPDTGPPHFDFSRFHWTKEISLQEAVNKLEKTMYPFKEIPYLDFLDAFTLAKQENKLVHSILLWGALDDQSC